MLQKMCSRISTEGLKTDNKFCVYFHDVRGIIVPETIFFYVLQQISLSLVLSKDGSFFLAAQIFPRSRSQRSSYKHFRHLLRRSVTHSLFFLPFVSPQYVTEFPRNKPIIGARYCSLFFFFFLDTCIAGGGHLFVWREVEKEKREKEKSPILKVRKTKHPRLRILE